MVWPITGAECDVGEAGESMKRGWQHSTKGCSSSPRQRELAGFLLAAKRGKEPAWEGSSSLNFICSTFGSSLGGWPSNLGWDPRGRNFRNLSFPGRRATSGGWQFSVSEIADHFHVIRTDRRSSARRERQFWSSLRGHH